MTTAQPAPETRAFRRTAAVAGIAVAALITGCSASNTPGESSPDLTGYVPGISDEQAQDADGGEGGETPAQGGNREADGLQPRYCYGSLANVTCYSAPQPERRNQRVGSFHEAAD